MNKMVKKRFAGIIIFIFMLSLINQSVVLGLTALALPSAPNDLSASVGSSNRINLTWSKVADALSYNIYRATGTAGSYIKINTVGQSSSSIVQFSNTGLEPGTLYSYKVSANNGDGEGSLSAPTSATTFSVIAPMITSPGDGQVYDKANINVSWNSISGATKYVLFVKNTTTDTVKISETNLTQTSYTIPSSVLEAGNQYKILLSSVDPNENQYPTSISFSIKGTQPTAPMAPISLSAAGVSSSQISLSWSRVSDATSYSVYRSTSLTGSYSKIGTIPQSTNPSYADSGLQPKTSYWYKVTALNSVGESPFSSTESATTAASESTVTPPNITNPSNGAIVDKVDLDVRWNSVNGAARYAFSLRDATNNTVKIAETKVSQTNYAISASFLEYNHQYSITVAAEDSANKQYPSTISFTVKNVITTPTVPITPTGLSASLAGTSQVNLGWNKVSNATTYYLYRGTSANGSFSRIGTIPQTTSGYLQYTDNVLGGNTYWYAVSAANSLGESGKSAPISVTTVPQLNPPVITSPANDSKIEKDKITVTWNPVSGAAKYSYSVTNLTTNATVVTDTETNQTNCIIPVSVLRGGNKYLVTVSSKDAYNNRWSASVTFTVTVIPTAPIIESPIDGGVYDKEDMVIKWNEVEGVSTYEVSVKDLENNRLVVPETEVTNTEFPISAELFATTHTYVITVAAKDEKNNKWPATTRISIRKAPTPVPLGLVTTPLMGGKASLKWSGVANALSYNIYRSNRINGSYIKVANVKDDGTNNLNYLDKNLLGETNYWYKVTAIFTDGEGSFSTPISVLTIETRKPKVKVNVQGGYYRSTVKVTLSIDEPGTIYYTLDGRTPTSKSPKYKGAIVITATKTIRFFAVDKFQNYSEVITQRYIIDKVPPRLSASAPKITTGPTAKISGSTESGCVVKINGSKVSVNSKGVFSTSVRLKNGVNSITVTAIDKAGNSRSVGLKITKKIPVKVGGGGGKGDNDDDGGVVPDL